MGAISQPLTAAQADRFRSAIGLLQAGASAQALTIAQALRAGATPWNALGVGVGIVGLRWFRQWR
jgi:hypothetical protein